VSPSRILSIVRKLFARRRGAQALFHGVPTHGRKDIEV